MSKIAILTPDPADPSYAGQWPQVLEVLKAALVEAGLQVHAEPWTMHAEDASGLKAYDLILPVIVWGYHRDHAKWLKACALWKDEGLPLANSAETLMWNSDKAYLQGLIDHGIPMAATRFVERVTARDIDMAFDDLASDVLIVKPTISAGAYRTLRLDRNTDWAAKLAKAPQGAAMIQSYLPTIETEGETSLFFFGGQLSHVVNKRPVTGEFRIQVQFGGQYQALESAPPEALDLAQAVLDSFGDDLLYARIDLTRDEVGQWVLMEAELIEPDFYLASAPQAGARFAQAVKARL
ncbi:ATP-grasp domain-containing protein [Brevundimonas sp.]|uniref:ATP-grasp domain-containing protein n=1 Tax=Brevundimonas sp. TaxID=1871086 RepID=UPI002FC74F94